MTGDGANEKCVELEQAGADHRLGSDATAGGGIGRVALGLDVIGLPSWSSRDDGRGPASKRVGALGDPAQGVADGLGRGVGRRDLEDGVKGFLEVVTEGCPGGQASARRGSGCRVGRFVLRRHVESLAPRVELEAARIAGGGANRKLAGGLAVTLGAEGAQSRGEPVRQNDSTA